MENDDGLVPGGQLRRCGNTRSDVLKLESWLLPKSRGNSDFVFRHQVISPRLLLVMSFLGCAAVLTILRFKWSIRQRKQCDWLNQIGYD